MRVGDIDKTCARKTAANIRNESIIAGTTIVLRVVDASKTLVEPRRNCLVVDDQISRVTVDVHSIADVVNLAAAGELPTRTRSGITDARHECVGQRMFQLGRVNIGYRCLEIGIDAADSKLQSRNSALRVERRGCESGVRKSERWFVGRAQAPHWSARGVGIGAIESWVNRPRRVAAILLLYVRHGRPVMEEPCATMQHP